MRAELVQIWSEPCRPYVSILTTFLTLWYQHTFIQCNAVSTRETMSIITITVNINIFDIIINCTLTPSVNLIGSSSASYMSSSTALSHQIEFSSSASSPIPFWHQIWVSSDHHPHHKFHRLHVHQRLNLIRSWYASSTSSSIALAQQAQISSYHHPYHQCFHRLRFDIKFTSDGIIINLMCVINIIIIIVIIEYTSTSSLRLTGSCSASSMSWDLTNLIGSSSASYMSSSTALSHQIEFSSSASSPIPFWHQIWVSSDHHPHHKFHRLHVHQRLNLIRSWYASSTSSSIALAQQAQISSYHHPYHQCFHRLRFDIKFTSDGIIINLMCVINIIIIIVIIEYTSTSSLRLTGSCSASSMSWDLTMFTSHEIIININKFMCHRAIVSFINRIIIGTCTSNSNIIGSEPASWISASFAKSVRICL